MGMTTHAATDSPASRPGSKRQRDTASRTARSNTPGGVESSMMISPTVPSMRTRKRTRTVPSVRRCSAFGGYWTSSRTIPRGG